MHDLLHEALHQLRDLQAEAAQYCDAQAMSLATVSAEGKPRVRTMSVSLTEDLAIVFFTNGSSRTGIDLAGGAGAALCVHWACVLRQVTVEGEAQRLDASDSDRHWSGRSRDNQLAAWASAQSDILTDRASLASSLDAQRLAHRDRRIPRPPSWHGYRLVPHRIEFWRSGWHKLSEKVCYEALQAEPRKVLINP